MIGIATAVYKREDVFKSWAKNMLHNFPNALVSVAYSEPHYKPIIEQYGFISVPKENKPLGWKFNAAIKALEGKCDNIIVTGSDDIISDNLSDFYKRNTDIDYVAFLDCFFYHPQSNKTKYWSGYNTPRRMGEPIGAGKMLSSNVMNQLKWQPFPSINKSLDWHFHNAVMNIGDITAKLSYLSELKDCYIIDIKNEVSMNKFENIPAREISNAWQKHTYYVA